MNQSLSGPRAVPASTIRRHGPRTGGRFLVARIAAPGRAEPRRCHHTSAKAAVVTGTAAEGAAAVAAGVGVPPTAVLGAYVNLMARSVCGPAAAALQQQLLSALACMQDLVLPAPSEQLLVLQAVRDIRAEVDISGLEAVIVKLVLAHDGHTLDVLVESLKRLHASQEQIADIVRYADDIPVTAADLAV